MAIYRTPGVHALAGDHEAYVHITYDFDPQIDAEEIESTINRALFTRPPVDGHKSGVECPTCKAELIIGEQYCNCCGQRINWESFDFDKSRFHGFIDRLKDKNAKREPYRTICEVDADTKRNKVACPRCGQLFTYQDHNRFGMWWDPIVRVIPTKPNYCPRCGQAIMWEDGDGQEDS